MKIPLAIGLSLLSFSLGVAESPVLMRQIWVQPLGGDAGPIALTHGRVIVGSLERDAPRRASLNCYSVQDGFPVWRNYHSRLADQFLDNRTTGIRSKPLVADDRLIYATNRGELYCLDLKHGSTRYKENWRVDLRTSYGVFKRDDVGTGTPGISATSCDGLVVVATGNGSTHNLHDRRLSVPAPEAPAWICFDIETGDSRWSNSVPSPETIHSSSASPAKVNDSLLIATGGDGGLYVLQSKSGKILTSSHAGWYWSWSSPAVSSDYVVVASSHPPGSDPKYRGTVTCFSVQQITSGKKLSPLWVFDEALYDGTWGAPILIGSSVFVLTQSLELLELDATSGHLVSQRTLDAYDFAQIHKIGQLLAVPNEASVLLYSPKRLEPIRTYDFPAFIDGPISFSLRRVFIAGRDSLRAYEPM